MSTPLSHVPFIIIARFEMLPQFAQSSRPLLRSETETALHRNSDHSRSLRTLVPAGSWKQYLHGTPQRAPLHLPQRSPLHSPLQSALHSTLDQPLRSPTTGPPSRYQSPSHKQQQMLRRVEEVQRRILPILRAHDDGEQSAGWLARMEARVGRLETRLEAVEGAMRVRLEARLIEVERQWGARMQGLLDRHQGRVGTRQEFSNTNNMSNKGSRGHSTMKNGYSISSSSNHKYLLQQLKTEAERESSQRPPRTRTEQAEQVGGYYTRRELEANINNG